MPITQIREIAAAHVSTTFATPSATWPASPTKSPSRATKSWPLNVGDPNIFDFKTPPHLIEAVYKAMRDGKNGYAPSPGIPKRWKPFAAKQRAREFPRCRMFS